MLKKELYFGILQLKCYQNKYKMFAHLYSGRRPLHSTNCTSSKQRYFYKLHSLQFKNFQSPSILTYSRCVDTVQHKVRASADLFCKNQQTAKSQN